MVKYVIMVTHDGTTVLHKYITVFDHELVQCCLATMVSEYFPAVHAELNIIIKMERTSSKQE